MMKILQALRVPPKRLVLWHTVAAVPMGAVVLLGAYLSYHYHAVARDNREHVDHAYEVLDVVDGLYISLQNADVAQREFIVTGDEARLAAIGRTETEMRDAAYPIMAMTLQHDERFGGGGLKRLAGTT